MKARIFLWALLIAVFCLISTGHSQVPQVMNYQGVLTDSSGNRLDGTYNMTFSVYDTSDGGTPLWTETQYEVLVDHGIFNVLLSIPDSVWSATEDEFIPRRYLGVSISSEPEMVPRREIGSVPYAYRALAGASADYWVKTGPVLFTARDWGISRYLNNLFGSNNHSHINLGRNSTTGTLYENKFGCTVGGGTHNTAGGQCATVPGGRGNTAAGDYSFACGHRAKADHPGTFVWADGTDADFASTATNQFLIRASGGVGIGTTSPAYALDVAGDIRSTGTIYGTVDNTDKVDGFHASSTPTANYLYPLDGSAKIPNVRLYTGSGNGLDADLLDGLHASAFLSTANDYGRSGVATDLYEGTSTLTSKYVNEGQANSITSAMVKDNQIVDADISATANISPSKINDGPGSGLDADLLDGKHASQFVGGSGTTNYIPKLTGSSTIANSVIYETGGNIGIGTTTPTEKLDVVGNVRADSWFYGDIWQNDGSAQPLRAWGNGSILFMADADNTYPASGDDIKFYSHGESDANLKMIITGDGNVGIGTTSPAYTLDVTGDIRSVGTIYGTVDNTDKVDGFHASSTPTANYLYPLDGSAKIPNVRLYTGSGNGLDADLLDGQHSSAFASSGHNHDAVYINDGAGEINAVNDFNFTTSTFVSNLDADKVDGFHAGNSSGQVPVSNGTRSADLNADMVDGVHAGSFTQIRYDGTLSAGSSATLIIPHYAPWTLQLSCGWPGQGGLCSVLGFENDRIIAVTYTKYNGDGTSAAGGAEGSEGSTTTLVSFGSGSYAYSVQCPGEATGDHNIKLTAAGVELRYRLIY